MSSWVLTPRLSRLRQELRRELPRPRRRWSDLALTCAMVSEADSRPPVVRMGELAERQTLLRYR